MWISESLKSNTTLTKLNLYDDEESSVEDVEDDMTVGLMRLEAMNAFLQISISPLSGNTMEMMNAGMNGLNSMGMDSNSMSMTGGKNS